MSDTESIIPEEEIPKIEKKTRKKKEMTPEMIEQLRLARVKAMEVKKALKGNPEARIEHYKEKLKQQKEKPTKKKLLEKAKDILKEEDTKDILKEEVKEDTPEQKLPEPEPEPEPEPLKEVIDDELDNNGLPKPPKQAIKKPEPEPSNFIDLSTDDKILNVSEEKVKTKKKVKYIYESDTDSEEERVVYVKKTHKKHNETPIPRPVIPTTFGGNINRFGSYGMLGRR